MQESGLEIGQTKIFEAFINSSEHTRSYEQNEVGRKLTSADAIKQRENSYTLTMLHWLQNNRRTHTENTAAGVGIKIKYHRITPTILMLSTECTTLLFLAASCVSVLVLEGSKNHPWAVDY